MPRAYCGLISLTLIKRILADHDALFGGVSPDIYSAALISAHSVNALDIDFPAVIRSEEHTSELQSLMRISYAVFCLKKKKNKNRNTQPHKYQVTYTHTNTSHIITSH